MREIKFRAFDNQTNKYEHWSSEENEYDGIFWIMIKRPEFPPPEQYTGLKDKNGKEIYEGDVFKTELTDSIGVVKFSHGVFGLRWQPPEQNRMLGSWGQKHDLRRFDDGQILEIGAVVGNIHENPELIQ